MDLRKELLKEEEISKEDQNKDLENTFIDYIKGKEISKENEEKILDELQKCVNIGNYKESIFRMILSYCDSPKAIESWVVYHKNMYDTSEEFIHASYVYDQLKDVREYPKVIKIVLNEIKNQEKKNTYGEVFNNYNNLLKANNIKELNENYTIEDLEISVIKFMETHQKKFFTSNENYDLAFDERNINLELDVLFYLKDNLYYLLNKNGRFKNSSWMKALYASYLLKNIEKKFLFSMEIRATRLNISDLQEYGFGIKKLGSLHNTYYIIYDKSNEKIIDSLLENYKTERDNFINISKKRLEKFILKLKNKISSKDDINQENLKTIMEDLNESNIKIFAIRYRTTTNILIIDDCFYAIVQNGNFDRIEYGYFTHQDYFTWEIEGTEENVDLSALMKISNSSQKGASVVGRTIVGSLIGGTLGGMVGAMSAIEKNKRVEYVRSQLENDPLIRTYTKKTAIINLILMCLLGDEINSKYLRIENSEIWEELIANLFVASSDEITINLKYIKKYFELNGDIDYDENKVNNFINSEIKEDQKRIADEYRKNI